jgi:hypothetical protein
MIDQCCGKRGYWYLMMDRHWSIRKKKERKKVMKTSQMLEDQIINYLSGDHIELTDDQPLEDVVMHILFWHQTEGEGGS